MEPCSGDGGGLELRRQLEAVITSVVGETLDRERWTTLLGSLGISLQEADAILKDFSGQISALAGFGSKVRCKSGDVRAACKTSFTRVRNFLDLLYDLQSKQSEAKYDLKDPKALADFLQDADIRLVRAKYLYQLHEQKTPLRRRQETELDPAALVSHAEVREWAEGRREAILCAVSHSWESCEHPDPCCFQLEQLVNCLALYHAAYSAEIWLFYDYVSLFQYRRQTSEDESFGRAMSDMHVVYAHDCTLTFRIESLTPKAVWDSARQDATRTVPVYHEPSGSVQAVPVGELTENRVPYRDRGWCRAEIEWSSSRGSSAQHQRIDVSAAADISCLRGRVATAPEDFAARMHSAQFTHRSDAEAVIALQEKIFSEKVTACVKVQLNDLPASEVAKLVQVLPRARRLRVMGLCNVEVDAATADALGKAVGVHSILQDFTMRMELPDAATAVVKALAAVLEKNKTMTHVSLGFNGIGDAGAQALALALERNSALTRIDLANNNIGDVGAQALAAALKLNNTMKDLDLRYNEIGDAGAQALAGALEQNNAMTHIDLQYNEIGDVGAQALAVTLEKNTALTHINLTCNGIGIAGAQALAAALKKNNALTHIDLAINRIGVEGTQALEEIEGHLARNRAAIKDFRLPSYNGQPPCAVALPQPRIEALAEVLKRNSAVARINLAKHHIGDQGAQALAQALDTNSAVTHINLRSSGLRSEGAQALAVMLEKNSTVTHINLECNDISDAGAEALAAALEKNQVVSHISLGNSGLGAAGARALAAALQKNSAVTHVELAGNWIDEAQALEDIERCVARNRAAQA
ncbi:unnamed protein product [Effrenium voratum]|nr:unnamed protein product [Effrenium voratum]